MAMADMSLVPMHLMMYAKMHGNLELGISWKTTKQKLNTIGLG